MLSFLSVKFSTQLLKIPTLKGAFAAWLLMFCSPLSATIIMAGSDYLETTAGTFLDFSFPGSPMPEIGIVDFIGDPAGPGNTDTLVRRLDDAVLPGEGSSDTIDVELVALSLASADPVDIGGTDFDLSIALTPTMPSLGQLTLTLDDEAAVSGSFESFFDVFVDIRFFVADTDILVETITALPLLGLHGLGQWQQTPAPDTVIVSGSYGDINANQHIPPSDEYADFFITEIVEVQPGLGEHRLQQATVPEPASVILLSLGLLAITFTGKRKVMH
ncbi:PEP-CTERM sorting domain-containing protein [Thalassomonas actiniarum]|uniref:PEP-CTERM sorting domain-containing protein n=1 Tax=Thalassomonas actiniarum TaxID=485447 RepID=A0AAE9YZU9_9GAMM|nr:PEP-CTERM sorting domain-containing protein [Thalassomonas actiniarum]WDE02657.1 PEP-CTERM sorting domain-containing protein [Thalassomonas actiniarum]